MNVSMLSLLACWKAAADLGPSKQRLWALIGSLDNTRVPLTPFVAGLHARSVREEEFRLQSANDRKRIGELERRIRDLEESLVKAKEHERCALDRAERAESVLSGKETELANLIKENKLLASENCLIEKIVHRNARAAKKMALAAGLKSCR